MSRVKRQIGLQGAEASVESEVELGWDQKRGVVPLTAPFWAGDVPMHVVTSIVHGGIFCSFEKFACAGGRYAVIADRGQLHGVASRLCGGLMM